MKKSGEDRPVATPAPVPIDLVCEIAEEGQFQRWNAGWGELVGLLGGNATLVSMDSGGSNIFDIVHSDDVANFTASFSSLRAGTRSVTTVFRVQGNKDICVEMQWSRLQHAGEGKTLIGVGYRRLAQEPCASAIAGNSADARARNHPTHVYAMSNNELAEFARTASHDLRAPLRAINGFAEIVCQDYADALDETGNDYLQRIRTAARRLSRTIDGVTDYLRLGGDGGSFRSVDLNGIVHDVAEVHQADDPTVPGMVNAQNLPTVHGDPIQLKLLVQELVANGLVHNQSKIPAVTVFQKLTDAETDRAVNDQRVLIVVSDNGCGIPAKDREAVFSPFRKLVSVGHASGLGLGLAMAKRIVQRHGGALRCLRGDDGGCQFVFDLQVVPSQKA